MTVNRKAAQATSRGGPEKLYEGLYLQSVGRAFEVLDLFRSAHRALTLNEIAAELGVTKSTAQRTVYTLVVHGYLEKADGVGYRLGLAILDNAFSFLRLDTLVQRAVPLLSELRRAANERVDLSFFDGTTTIYALRYQSKRETFYTTLLGRRRPTFLSAGGRACLAHLEDAAVNDILARSDLTPVTPRTTVAIPDIWDKIREARRDTYAWSEDEVVIGEIAVAAAVLDAHRRPVGAVHIAGLSSDWSAEEFRRQFAPLVLEAATGLSG